MMPFQSGKSSSVAKVALLLLVITVGYKTSNSETNNVEKNLSLKTPATSEVPRSRQTTNPSVAFVLLASAWKKDIIEEKRIIDDNVRAIVQGSEGFDVTFFVFLQDESFDWDCAIKNCDEVRTKVVKPHEYGIASLRLHLHPIVASSFDYVHLVRGGVSLPVGYSLRATIDSLVSNKCQIAQQSAEPRDMGWKWMRSKPVFLVQCETVGQETGIHFLEMLSYVMTSEAYAKYHSLLGCESRAGWGIEKALPLFFERMCLCHGSPVTVLDDRSPSNARDHQEVLVEMMKDEERLLDLAKSLSLDDGRLAHMRTLEKDMAATEQFSQNPVIET